MSCPSMESLDFTSTHPCLNSSDTNACEELWPCEVRLYWMRLLPFVEVTRLFLSYGSLVTVTLGVILNSLSFYVLISSGLSKNGSGIYLVTLAICDSANLLSNILVGVLRGLIVQFNQIFMDYDWLCKIHAVCVEVFQTISAWIVVAFTVERCVAVWYPMALRQNRQQRSRIVVISITLVFTSFSLSKLFVTGFEKDSVFGYTPCNAGRYVWDGMAYVRVAFQTWIPTVVVFTFNCLMFWKLRKIRKHRVRLTEKIVRATAPVPNTRRVSFIKKPSPTNPMLIAVSLAYLILVFPLGVVQTIELHWNVHHKISSAVAEPQRSRYISWITYKLLLKYLRSFLFGLYQLNFAINFFLYFAAGVEFRCHLQKKINSAVKLCRWSSKEGNARFPSQSSNTTSVTGLPSTSTTSANGIELQTVASSIQSHEVE